MALSATVDRIEGSLAVLELDGTYLHVPVSDLPEGIAEGDGLTLQFVREPRSTTDAEARLARLRRGRGKNDTIDL